MKEERLAKPFLKWAGGKSQLISEITARFPEKVTNKKFTYIEPFIGSGALLFHIANNYPSMERAVINDINKELINTYQIIAKKPEELIEILDTYQEEYHSLEEDKEKKKEYYYEKRTLYNSKETDKTVQAALLIFLNRTCFNGLYRVNRKNLFNVPIGSYRRPTISDKKNILAVSKVLQRVEILSGDFTNTLQYAGDNTLFYFDPPYKPISETSSFNSYSKESFDDSEQKRLKEFCDKLDEEGHSWILSNSDLKNGSNNPFFDNLYSNYKIERVEAKRMINSRASSRGVLTELLISN